MSFVARHAGGVVRGRWLPAVEGTVAVLTLAVLMNCESAQSRTVRVGVYDNPPKVEMGKAGTPRGIFIDIIEDIARREGWKIEYVYGTWEADLTRLEEGNIDLMPDVAFSEARNQRFDFNQLTVLSSWLQVFRGRNVAVESVADLEGKTMAVLEGSIQQQVCGEIRDRFGLSFNQIALPDYESTIKEVESGRADAAMVSRFYGYRREREGRLVPTPVILHPTSLQFAAPKGQDSDLLDAIDKHIAAMMDDPHSVYYRSLGSWLSEEPRTFVPRIVVWGVVALAAGFLLFLSWSCALRRQVCRRTEDLARKNRDLADALRNLKTARDEAVKRERLYAFGQLASGVAHDFNNLLIPIINYAEMMLTVPGELDKHDEVRKNLGAIKTAARHGAEIVRRMQQFYRSAGHPGDKERLDINDIIREAIDLARPRWTGSAGRSGPPVDLLLSLHSESAIVGRRSEVSEAVLNLLLNAADAMPQGGRLEVSTEDVGGHVRIAVKDNGEGMTEEVRAKCLQPFFTTKGEKGTGLGLTMVSTIVQDHGGSMEIDSAPGSGACITMILPAASPE